MMAAISGVVPFFVFCCKNDDDMKMTKAIQIHCCWCMTIIIMMFLKNFQTVDIHNKDRFSVGLQGGSNDDDDDDDGGNSNLFSQQTNQRGRSSRDDDDNEEKGFESRVVL